MRSVAGYGKFLLSAALLSGVSTMSEEASGKTATHSGREHAPRHIAAPSKAGQALEQARLKEKTLKTQQEQAARSLAGARAAEAAARRQAEADAARARQLSAATVSAAASLQDTETRLAALEEETDRIRMRQEEVREDISLDAAALAPVLPVARRLALYPADSLIAAPSSTQDAVTALLVIRGLSATLEQDAEGLQKKREELIGLDNELAERTGRTKALQQTQATQKATLLGQMNAARSAQQQADSTAKLRGAASRDAAAKAEALKREVALVMAEEASALLALQREAEEAERRRKAAEAEVRREARKREAEARARRSSHVAAREAPAAPAASPPSGRGGGSLVAGTLVTAWGARTETGPASGMTFSTLPGALVRSPCSGQVDFAGPFRSFGHMLILNCGGGYRFVLAGLGGLNVADGQSLPRGAGIGTMPSGGHPSLLVQLRNGSRAVNPASRL
ncbi:peptidoglycan DD-metalloendopeptidase family protein [Acetobacter sp. AN02]|uniref:murein hydrolase activator EnvC family protein n=1 Tax=Acetobacter sp. AN02 TaxID=2894186 RepID=UPI0024344597|nr:peptidoglycan DD-metalloendopeptidase family protein [Acetobacter sp. AN02]MDG6094964.1 peptidoglycan DD-metalloendopeptidase family protein [Acetobacter sp. AN02]